MYLLTTISDIKTNAATRVRETGFRLMCVKPVNTALRSAVKPFSKRLPWGVVHSIPMIGEIEIDLPDGRQLVLVSDGYDSLASRMYWSGIDGFEPESLRLFLELAETSDTVMDVGAHVGLYALLAAVDRPDVTTVAFEPVPRNLGYLRTNVGRNNAPSLRVEAAAVGERPGTIELNIPETLRLPATASILENGSGTGNATKVATEVAMMSLDSYAEEHDLTSVDLIKIDVEGAEDDVLRGAQRIIEDHRPAIICEVLHGVGNAAASTEMFKDTNYRFFLVTDDGLIEHSELVGDPSYFYKNYLLIPDDKIAERLKPGQIIEAK